MSSGLGLGPVSSISSSNISPPPSLAPGQAAMSPQEVHIVFANLIEIAEFANAFAGLLDGAGGSNAASEIDDRIGEVFVEMVRFVQILRFVLSANLLFSNYSCPESRRFTPHTVLDIIERLRSFSS